MLVVLDGFGIGRRPEADAIAAARMPAWRGLLARWPNAVLEASAEAVGLPAGQMGNSEVGHLNLGAGRPVPQDLPRIDAAIADGSFKRNEALLAACLRAADGGQRLHLITLIGPGGVHAQDRHAIALAALAHEVGTHDVVIHALLDGRDTPPRSGRAFLVDFEARLRSAHPDARIATVGGRYFAMDRDKRWDRTERGYRAMVRGEGLEAPHASAAVRDAYAREEGDEFVQPTIVRGVDGRVRDDDALVHLNFRADRARQLVHALADDAFDGFERGARPRGVLLVTMSQYQAGLPVLVAFPPVAVRSLAQQFSELGWRQFHVAETEKYAHVTYFFNGGVEAAWPGEERLLIPSPLVATYDLQPEMSAAGVTDALLDAVTGGAYDFIVANYANPDMVGHTGDWDATVRALEFLDTCLERVAATCLEADRDALLCVAADHGNADEMRDADGRSVTAHSLNPVRLLLAGRAVESRRLRSGELADVAPTLLELARLDVPAEMTGRSLLQEA